MAIHADLAKAVLPFPHNRRYLHDVWIGTSNDRQGGGMVFLPTPLLFYRRHNSNVSRKLGLWERILSRMQLLLDHIHAMLREHSQSR